ncbi:MAG: alkyl hydroperoxide reductase [Bacillota bacterium]|nr:MAG: alkyl hydroperoxide reductase [Bacillota bacterium]
MNRLLGGAVLVMVIVLLFGGSLRPQEPVAPAPRDSLPAPGSQSGEPGGQPLGNPTTTPGPAAPVAVGTPAPDFELRDLKGRTVRLSDFRGKVVFLNFWATWCPPCRQEMPEIRRLVEKNPADVVVVGVNTSDTASPAEVQAFMEQNGYRWLVLYDEGSLVGRQYGVVYLPTSYFIGPDGTVRGKYIGPMSLPVMERHIQQARQGR